MNVTMMEGWWHGEIMEHAKGVVFCGVCEETHRGDEDILKTIDSN